MAIAGSPWTKFNQAVAIKFKKVAEYIGMAAHNFTPTYNSGQPESVVAPNNMDPALYGWTDSSSQVSSQLTTDFILTTVGPDLLDTGVTGLGWNYWRHPTTKEVVSWQGAYHPYGLHFQQVIRVSGSSKIRFRNSEYSVSGIITDVKFKGNILYVFSFQSSGKFGTFYIIDTSLPSPTLDPMYLFYDGTASQTQTSMEVYGYTLDQTYPLSTHDMTVQTYSSPALGIESLFGVFNTDCTALNVVLEKWSLMGTKPDVNWDSIDYVCKLTLVDSKVYINNNITDTGDPLFSAITETNLSEGSTFGSLLSVNSAVGSQVILGQRVYIKRTKTTTSTVKETSFTNEQSSWWGGNSNQNTLRTGLDGTGTLTKPEDTRAIESDFTTVINAKFGFTSYQIGSFFYTQTVDSIDTSALSSATATQITATAEIHCTHTVRNGIGELLGGPNSVQYSYSCFRAVLQSKKGTATHQDKIEVLKLKPYKSFLYFDSAGDRHWIEYDQDTSINGGVAQYDESIDIKEFNLLGDGLVANHPAHNAIVTELQGYIASKDTSVVESTAPVQDGICRSGIFVDGLLIGRDTAKYDIPSGYKSYWKIVNAVVGSPVRLTTVEDHKYQVFTQKNRTCFWSDVAHFDGAGSCYPNDKETVYGSWYSADKLSYQTPVDVTLTGDLLVKKRGQVTEYGTAKLNISVDGVEKVIVDRAEKYTNGVQQTPSTATGEHSKNGFFGSSGYSVAALPNVGSPSTVESDLGDNGSAVYFQQPWGGFRVPLGESPDYLYSGFLFYWDEETPLYQAKYARQKIWLSDSTGALPDKHDVVDSAITYNDDDILSLPREDGSTYDLTTNPSPTNREIAIGIIPVKK